MKTPAIKVLKARIMLKASKQRQAQQLLDHSKQQAYHIAREANLRVVAEATEAAFNKSPAKYVTYKPDRYSNPVKTNQAWDEKIKEIEAKYPAPELSSESQTHVGIASLDLNVCVLMSKLKEWQEFALSTDDAFLEDDAKGILVALEKLS